MNFARSAGQSCGSTSRLLVHESIADEVVDAATEMGTLASAAQYDKTLRCIRLAWQEGADLVTGGGPSSWADLRPGPSTSCHPARIVAGSVRARHESSRSWRCGPDDGQSIPLCPHRSVAVR
jgi:Aldehyde dehydrogenase family